MVKPRRHCLVPSNLYDSHHFLEYYDGAIRNNGGAIKSNAGAIAGCIPTREQLTKRLEQLGAIREQLFEPSFDEKYFMCRPTSHRLAAEALLQEAELGAKRAEVMGPSGWIKPKQTINKRFLHSTLRNAVLSNKHRRSKKDNICDEYSKGDNNDGKLN